MHIDANRLQENTDKNDTFKKKLNKSSFNPNALVKMM